MKKFLLMVGLLVPLWTNAQPSPAPAATQEEVNAGTVPNKYVSPKTLGGYTLVTNVPDGTTIVSDENGVISVDAYGLYGAPLVTNWSLGDVVIVGEDPEGITNLQGSKTLTGLNITGTFTGDGMVRPEAFGGAGDGKRLFDAELTSESTTLTTPSGTFTDADIGKVVIVYLDNTNVTFFVTGIAGVTSTTEITLSNESPATASSMTVVYGTDNTAAISNAVHAAWAMGGGVVQFKNGIYLVAGAPVQQDAGVNGVIRLPSAFIRGSVLSTNITVEFRGTVAPVLVYSSQSPPAPINGSIIYTISKPVEFSRANALFSHSISTDYCLEQYVFKNLLFRQPMGGNRLWDVFAKQGGGLILEDVMFDTEFPTNYLDNGAVRRFSPTNTVQNSTSPGAVWFPKTSNDANSRINRFGVFGRGGGIRGGEHLRMANGIFEYGGTGVGLDIASTFSGPVIEGVQFLCMDYPFHVLVPGGDYNQVLNARGIEFEGHGLTKAHIYDLSNTLSGIFTWRNDEPLTNTVETKLTMVNENDGSWYFGNSKYGGGIAVGGGLASELGTDSLLNGLLFDVRFSESTNFNRIYNRAPTHRSRGGLQVGAAVIVARTNTPVGVGVHLLANSGYLWATNSFPDVTNLTCSVIFRTSAGTIQYPMLFDNSVCSMWIGNGTQIGWKIKNTAGTLKWVDPDIAPSGLSDGRWHEMTGTYDGATMVLYVDGLPVGSASQTNWFGLSTNTFTIGNTAGVLAIAKPRIWNRALGPDEILAMSRKNLGIEYVASPSIVMTTNKLTVVVADITNTAVLNMDFVNYRHGIQTNLFISGVLNVPANTVKKTSILFVGDGSNPFTVSVPAAFATHDTVRTWTVTNSQKAKLDVEVWGNISTNVLFRNLY